MKKIVFPIFIVFCSLAMSYPMTGNAAEMRKDNQKPSEILYKSLLKDTPEVTKTGIQPRIKVATLKYQTEAIFTRPNGSSPWVLQYEDIKSTIEVRYNTGWKTEYRIDKVQEVPAGETGSGPTVLRIERRTYKYTGY